MKTSEKFAWLGLAGIGLLIIGFIFGYAWNIVKLLGMLGGEITAFFIARCVGVFFPPFGSVLGFF